MTGFLDELQAAVGAVAERVGPAVVGLGRGWGRGSGVVIAEGRVLTNAHVLRGEEVAVRRADGEVALGRVAGADDALDVAVIAVDTGAAPAVAWEPAAVEQLSAGPARLRARRSRRPRAAYELRARDRDRALLPRPGRAPHRRLDRALGAAAARLVRRSAGRCRRAAAGDQLRAHGGRAAARAARRRRAARHRGRARSRRGAGPSAARPGARAAARRAPDARRRRPARARRAARPRRRGREPRRRARGCSPATCWSPRPAGRCTASTTSSTRSRAPRARSRSRSSAAPRSARSLHTSVCEALR